MNKKPRAGTLPVVVDFSPPIGMEFTEEMKGYITESVTNATTPEEYKAAEERGKQEGNNLSLKLTMYIDSVDRFVAESSHEARAEGHVNMHALKHTVEGGRFNLFIEDQQAHTKRMRYSLQFYGEDGQPYLLDGYKEIRDDPEFDVWEIWKDNTTLFATLYKGQTTADPILGQGIVRVHFQDFIKLLTTFRVRNAPDVKAEVRAKAQVMSFFFGSLWETYVKQLPE